MRGQRRAAIVTVACNDVHRTRRETGDLASLGDERHSERIEFRRLHDDGVADRECGAQTTGGEFRWEVPGNDVRGNAVRFGDRVVDEILAQRDVTAFDLIGEATVIFEVTGCDVGFVQRLFPLDAAFERQDLGHFLRAAAQFAGDGQQHAATLAGAHIHELP